MIEFYLIINSFRFLVKGCNSHTGVYRPKLCVKCNTCVERIKRHAGRAHNISGKENLNKFVEKYSKNPIITIDPVDEMVQADDPEPDSHEKTGILCRAKKFTSAEFRSLKLNNDQWKF